LRTNLNLNLNKGAALGGSDGAGGFGIAAAGKAS